MNHNSSITARAVRFTETGGPDVLHIENIEIPAPAAHEVRLKVKAIGLNRADVMYRTGFYVENPIFPAKIGYEAAGIIDAIGSDVQDFKPGDVVNIIPAFSLHDYGTYGDVILIPAYTLQKYPSALSFEEAAAVWTSFLTAYGILINSAKLKSGQSVLITAASSSAGLALIQLVNFAGGVSIAVTSTNEKKNALLKAGAAHVVVAADQDIAAEVKKITGDKGADIILDSVGGPLFTKLIPVVAAGGQVFIYGAMSQEPAVLPFLDVLIKLPTIKAFTALDVMTDHVVLQAAIKYITDGINEGKLKPIIAKSFPLDEIVAAHKYLESNQHLGKIIVTV